MKSALKQIGFLASCLVIILVAGCGEKTPENVVKQLEKKFSEVSGYKMEAEMTMQTGQEARNYDIDIWYQKGEESFYRVVLENDEGEGGQVILRNEEGVFVLTPALKKSFKFQKDWPDNSSQPYLYQSLLKDITSDKEATYTATDSHYVFQTKTNYQNNTNLPYQEVHFDKKSLMPAAVKVMDKEREVVIDVVFTSMEVDPSFAANDFNRESILDSALADMSVANMEELQQLAVLYPLETLGAELVEKKEVSLDSAERVILTFKGEKNFTLIQEQPTTLEVAASDREMQGELVSLGHSVGAVSDAALEWNFQGTDFYLASEDLTIEELIEVAASVQARGIK